MSLVAFGIMMLVADVVAAAVAIIVLRRVCRKSGCRYPTADDITRGGILGCPGCGLVGEHTDDCLFRPIG